MYTYNELLNLHIELSSNCQAKCPMCARNCHGGLDNPKLKISDIDLDFFKKIVPIDLAKNIPTISFCGNYGDPLLNNDLLKIAEYLCENNSNIEIHIHTNGSLKNTQWWVELAKTLNKNGIVHFALDGLEDTHSLYRINTEFNKIIKNATSYINAGGRAIWTFITFKHNEHQLLDAKELSKKLGFEGFQEKQSARFIGKPYFEVLDKESNVTHILEQPSTSKVVFIDKKMVENYKEILKSATIECSVEKTKSVYIDAFGYLWPCCFVGAVPYVFVRPDQLGYQYQQDSYQSFLDTIEKFGGIEMFNLRNRSIQDIIDSIEWQTVWKESFKNNPMRICARTCGKFDNATISQSKDQFLEFERFE